ncbi:MAG: septum formation initiator family protein [Nitrospirota bacterium]|nr:septum formation initiator family protein [Nitrospirota bacterium]
MRNVRRHRVQQDKKRRGLVFITFGILVLIYLTLNLVIGENGLLKYIELNRTKSKLMAETVAIKGQVKDISSQMELLKNEPHLFEESAREYGLTKEGELIFKFDEKDDSRE